MEKNLKVSEIKKHLKTQWLGKSIVYKTQVDSTNAVAKNLALKGGEHGTLILCDSQSKGKGRRGREWISKEGMGIWMSMIIKPKINPFEIQAYTFAAALASVKGLLSNLNTVNEIKIKWPNDLIFQKKKLGGILLESSFKNNQLDFLIVGIGINVQKEAYPPTLKNQAVSLEEMMANPPNKEKMIADILNHMEKISKIIDDEGIWGIKEEYYQYSCTIGEEVKVEKENPLIGIATGIDKLGRLLVIDDKNQLHTLVAEDVSIRGVMDYV